MTIGNQLKKARQKKGVSLNDAYQQIRIHADALMALEEDNFSKLPNPIYAKSFLKEYSSYLGLDVEKILEEYNSLEQDLDRPEPKEEISLNKEGITLPVVDKDKVLNFVKIVGIGLALYLSFMLVTKTTSWVRFKFSQFAQNRVKKAQIREEEKKIEEETEKVKEVPQEVVLLKEPVIVKDIKIAKEEKLKLSVMAVEDVWIELKVDGKIIFKSVLKKGAIESWNANDNFEIWTGNASAMQLTLNDNLLASPGKGVIKGILIDRNGLKK